MGVVLACLLFGIWSLAFPLGKCMVAYSSPIFLTGLRMTVGGIILMSYLAFRKQLPKLSKRQLVSIVFLAFFSIYLSNILEFWSLCHLSAAKTCFIYSLSPFIAALLSFVHFKEKITPKKWLGISIGVMGFLPVITMTTGSEGLFHAFLGFSWPELAMIGATFFSIYGWVILRMVVKNESLSPLFANGGSMLLGGLGALLTSFFIDPWTPLPIAEGSIKPLLGLILLLTFISNILCYNLYGYLLKRFTATVLSLFGLLSPLFTSLHSWFLLNEPPSLTIILSTLIVLSGLVIVYFEERRQGYIASPSPSQ